MEKKLRILVLTSESRMISNRLWGAARELIDDLLVVGPDDTDESLPAGHIALPATGLRSNKLTFWHLQGLSGVIKGFKPDLIHVNNELWGVTVLEVASFGRPFVVLGAENLFHGEGVIARIRMGIAERIIPRLAGYASWNIAGVRHVAARREASFPELVCPAIIPPSEFVPSSWQPHEAGQPRKLLLIGRLEEEKGFDKVIQAVGRLSDKGAYQIHLCGTGPQGEALQAQADSLGVDLRRHGFVSPEEVAELMTHMTCAVQPSQTVTNWAEQFGRTVAEAMTVGLPCLVSDSGELPNVVNDPECVFPESDVVALSEKIDWLCSSAERLTRKSLLQAAEANRWAPGPAAAAMVDFWRRCLAHHQQTCGLETK
ncbi:glycosyltransferase family 4 protein [Luteococcus sp.]|uniref:glycosyltransferase family 4 protein n=1 Tax=Luteococcus sp. TaxID=1969402 RepID=UPI00373607B6